MGRQKYFKYDLERFFLIKSIEKASFARKLRTIIDNFGIQCVAIYRMRKFCHRLYRANRVVGVPIYLFAFIVSYIAELVMGVRLDISADIGPGFYIVHPSSIFVGGKIGRNCTIYQGVTIGWGGGANRVWGTPTIGDDVWIGPNSVIVGSITIGARATISAGSVVSRDIPEDALAAGNPCRVVSTNYSETRSYVKAYSPAEKE